MDRKWKKGISHEPKKTACPLAAAEISWNAFASGVLDASALLKKETTQMSIEALI
jgi:hypothetical protein